MLDTLSLVQLIQQQGRVHQSRYQEQKDAARWFWQSLIMRQDIQQQLMRKKYLGFIEPLDTCFRADTKLREYAVCGIDGSQIYPDRHEGFAEYLINIGTAYFRYAHVSHAELKNKPYLFSGFESGTTATLVTPEFVNGQRTYYELKHATEVARYHELPIIMFDGALMFWHLQTPAMQERFLVDYVAYLALLHTQDTKYLGYISASHSREIVTLLEQAAPLMDSAVVFDHLVDTDIMEFFLKPGEFTQVFSPLSDLSNAYPAPLRPCFMYLHVGNEIARIELPTYIADRPDTVTYLATSVLDQVAKGNGYPVALSEAHEQAVVKAADRDFFYQMLQTHYQKRVAVSSKLSKKRSAAV